MLKRKIASFIIALLSFMSLAQAAAEAPTLKITGFTAVNGIFSHQGTAENGKGGSQPDFSIGASNLYFTATGKSSSGLEYKARIVFDAYSDSDPVISQNYIEVLGDLGTVQFGNLNGPSDTMPESALNLIGGAGGIDGACDGVYNVSEGVISGVNNSIESKKTTKLVLYSPDLGNQSLGYFQLGVAYTPNTSVRGRSPTDNSKALNPGIGYMGSIYPDKDSAPFGLRQVTTGIKYKKEFTGFDIALAAIGITERSVGVNNTPVQNGRAYNLTAAVGISKWRFATGYLNNYNSRLPRYDPPAGIAGIPNTYANTSASAGNAGKAWNFGGSYTMGSYQFAAGYFNTNRKTDATNKATSDIYTATVDFTALEGLKLYAEVDYCITKTNKQLVADHQLMYDNAKKGKKAIANNRGTVFILGTKVSF